MPLTPAAASGSLPCLRAASALAGSAASGEGKRPGASWEAEYSQKSAYSASSACAQRLAVARIVEGSNLLDQAVAHVDKAPELPPPLLGELLTRRTINDKNVVKIARRN